MGEMGCDIWGKGGVSANYLVEGLEESARHRVEGGLGCGGIGCFGFGGRRRYRRRSCYREPPVPTFGRRRLGGRLGNRWEL